MQLLSLFCGAGGLDLGFHQAGFDIRVAIDLSEAAVMTHRHNFSRTTSLNMDLLEMGVEGMIKLCRQYFSPKQTIGIIGGPPCQGFSRGNIKSHINDPRNKLATLYVEFIAALNKIFNVKFVVFENVMGLKDKKHFPTYQLITKRLSDNGFDVFENELNAVDFGVAQERKRVILIAIKQNEYYSDIEIIKNTGKVKTVRDFISELPEPSFYSKKIKPEDIIHHPNHWTMVPKSEKFKNPELLANKTRSFRTINWDKPSPTIAYGNREIYVHPNKNRRLSIFESMLLQGFPKDFILKGTLSQQVTQVSNAVPPPMAKQIALSIKKSIRG